MNHFYTQSIPVTHQRVTYIAMLFLLLGLMANYSYQTSPTVQAGQTITICGIPIGATGPPPTVPVKEHFVFADTEEIQWSQVAPQPVKNAEAQTVVIQDKMYVFGGFDKLKSGFTPTDRAYVFDPKANSWTPIAAMPAMNGTGHGGVTHAGFATDGNDVYFAGGYTANAAGNGQIFGTKEVWKYQVASNSYVRLPDLPVPLSAGELEYINGKLHWVGGTNKARTEDLGLHYVLDLGKLSQGWTSAAALPNPRNHLGSAVHEGKLYVFGGQHGHDGKLVTQDDVHRYDPATQQWQKVADMPQALGHITGATFTFGDRIFILGGETAHGSAYHVSDVVAYHPLTNTWTKFTDLPAKRSSGVAGVMDGVIYYSSGSSSTTTYKGVLASSPPPPPSTGSELWLEAECAASVGANWQVVNDAAASAGAYVAAKSGFNSGSTPPTGSADRVTFNVNISKGATYHMLARVKAPASNANSFWVRVDGGSWMKWHIPETGSNFAWEKLYQSPFSLAAGAHTIDFAYREGGTLLDKLYLTTSTAAPSGTGKTAFNSCSPDTGGDDGGGDGGSTAGIWLEAECATNIGTNWTVVNSTAASAGAYVSIKHGFVSYNDPPTAPENIVSFNFNITKTSTYHLFARVKAPNIEDNSFWIRVDNGSWAKWDISTLTYDAFDWRTVQNSPFTFSTTGVHKIDFAYREDGTLLDKLYLTTSNSAPTGMGQSAGTCSPDTGGDDGGSTAGIWLEAECAGQVGGNWNILKDGAASAGAYVAAKNGFNSGSTPPTGSADRVTLSFSIAKAGTYHLFARVIAPSGKDNSFWVRIDGGNWILWSIYPYTNSFDWREIRNSPFNLGAGTHTIDFAYREDGTLLDKLYLTTSTTTPSGVGGTAANCGTATAARYVTEPSTPLEYDRVAADRQDVIVFPNPGEGLFTIRLGDDSFRSGPGGWLMVSTLQGDMIRKVYFISGLFTLDLTDVSPGVYVVQIWTAEGTVVKRVEKF